MTKKQPNESRTTKHLDSLAKDAEASRDRYQWKNRGTFGAASEVRKIDPKDYVPAPKEKRK